MFARQSYTFNEDDVIGIVEVVLSGAVREDALVIVTGGKTTGFYSVYNSIMII